MKDIDWKIWLVILALGLGGVFEILKHAPIKSAARNGWDLDFFGGSNSNPYNVKNAKGSHRPKAEAVAAEPIKRQASPELEAFIAANKPQTTEFMHNEKGEEGKADVKKKADSEYEIFVDPVTGKMYRKKKRKKPKGSATPVVEEEVIEAKKEEPKKEEESIDAAIEAALVSRNLTPSVADNKPKTFMSFEEWVARLLNHADLNETKKFIEAYKSNLVSADIFYKIVGMMIEDSRPEIKDLGVLCAGVTPSVLSFQYLADIVRTVPSTEKVRRTADGFVNAYSDLGNLYILERILKTPSGSYSTILASKKLEQSVQRYLSPEAHKPPADPTVQSTGQHSNAGYFQRFVVILESLVRNADQEISSVATTTLTDLRAHLTVSPTTDAPPAADSTGDVPPTQASTQSL